jgi:hypothetical protein
MVDEAKVGVEVAVAVGIWIGAALGVGVGLLSSGVQDRSGQSSLAPACELASL